MWRARHSILLFSTRIRVLFSNQLDLGRLVIWRTLKTPTPGSQIYNIVRASSNKPFVDLDVCPHTRSPSLHPPS
jgi:hypothetical protein